MFAADKVESCLFVLGVPESAAFPLADRRILAPAAPRLAGRPIGRTLSPCCFGRSLRHAVIRR